MASIVLLTAILLLSFFLRFYKIDAIPMGIDGDEASQGYDAYSILRTGKDRYGQAFPIFLRSFSTYQSPLYTYLTIIPTFLFGLSVFSTRLISVISGIVLVLITYFIIRNLEFNKKNNKAITTGILLSISPWAILFSRTAVEANLALILLILSILLLLYSLSKKWLFLLGCFVLGLTTYAYHAERLISTVFLVSFILIFKKNFFQKKRFLIMGIIIFLLMQLPQFILFNTKGFNSRLSQVNFWNRDYFINNGQKYHGTLLGRVRFTVRKFIAQYINYFSPKNLFFEPDTQPIRSIPDLSIFYSWMIVPLLFGIREFIKRRSEPLVKTLILLLLVSPLPAALTREPFYTLRSLPVFYVITIIISFGFYYILAKFSSALLRYTIFIVLFIFSLSLLYNSYFILLKYERAENFGFYYIRLINSLSELKDKNIVIDSTRANLGIWYFYIKKYDPARAQQFLSQYIKDGYYNSQGFNEKYKIDNLEIRPINLANDPCKNQILIGDTLAISQKQEIEHHLTPFFRIEDESKKVEFIGYLTNPEGICKKI